MYKLEKQDYGFRLSITGDFDEIEIRQLAEEIASFKSSKSSTFSIFVDTRKMMTLSQSTLATLAECQKMALQTGLVRSVVVLSSPVLKDQITRVAIESGISDRERVINAASNKNWQSDAMNWLLHGIEPVSQSAHTL